jgi:hypothetical protein
MGWTVCMDTNTGNTPRPRSQQEIASLLAAYRSSQQTQKEFCRAHGVGLGTLGTYPICVGNGVGKAHRPRPQLQPHPHSGLGPQQNLIAAAVLNTALTGRYLLHGPSRYKSLSLTCLSVRSTTQRRIHGREISGTLA